MDLGLSGRTVLVVGASKGLGLEIAREFHCEGAKVTSVARSEVSVPWRHIMVDLMPEDGPGRLVRFFQDPDIVVHVLGGSQGMTKTLSPSADWAKVWRLNLGIAHDLNCQYIPMMQRNKWGRIIHLSSNATKIPTGYAPYTSAKAALEGYVRSVSKDFSKDGVIITAVAPGIIYTPGRYYASLDSKAQEEFFNRYIPIQRFGRAEEVAKVITFLASEHAAYMAGSIVSVDGGAR